MLASSHACVLPASCPSCSVSEGLWGARQKDGFGSRWQPVYSRSSAFVTSALRTPAELRGPGQPHWDPSQAPTALLFLGTQVCLCPALAPAFRTGPPRRYPCAVGSFLPAPSPPLAPHLSTTKPVIYAALHTPLLPQRLFSLSQGKRQACRDAPPPPASCLPGTGWIPRVKAPNVLLLPLLVSAHTAFGYQLQSSLEAVFSSAVSPVNH